MTEKLSESLINLSTMMMVAKERGEFVNLASKLAGLVENAMEIEKLSCAIPSQKKATLSTSIKFTTKEIETMSKTFKKEFIANGLVARMIKRPSGKNGFYYEIRYRRNGYNISVSNKDLKKAKALFVEATKKLESPEKLSKENLKFGTVAQEWLQYKKGKIAKHTWYGYDRNVTLYLSSPEWKDRPITLIRTAQIDEFMHGFDNQPRKYEDLRTVLNSIFKYAIASGVLTHNPVTLVPFKRAERENREALTNEEVFSFLKRLQYPRYDKIRQTAYVIYFFGVRPCEIDHEAVFENGFLICRNRKRKNGKIEYKKIPVPKQAQGLIEFDKPITYQYSYSRFMQYLKEALGNGYTPYNLRHTFASICSEHVKEELVDVWMGDSSERLVGKVYVHFRDEFMRAQMDKVEFPVI